MKNRIKILREKIIKIENEIAKLKEITARDVVSGGLGGVQHFVIEGVPNGIVKKKEKILQKRLKRLAAEELELLKVTGQAEEYIESMENMELKNMFELYYLRNMTWNQTAKQMNKMYRGKEVPYTAENCRQKNSRFFKKNE